MSNETMKAILEELMSKQKADVEQIARYKALMMQLDETVRERSLVIKLLECGNNPEQKNNTLAQVMNYV